MTANTGGWWCKSCGSFETADGKVYPAVDAIKEVNGLTTHPTEATFWCKFRVEAAKDILCAVLSASGRWEDTTYEGVAAACVKQADELIKQLKGDGKD